MHNKICDVQNAPNKTMKHARDLPMRCFHLIRNSQNELKRFMRFSLALYVCGAVLGYFDGF